VRGHVIVFRVLGGHKKAKGHGNDSPLAVLCLILLSINVDPSEGLLLLHPISIEERAVRLKSPLFHFVVLHTILLFETSSLVKQVLPVLKI
jgi:hypothetical protein